MTSSSAAWLMTQTIQLYRLKRESVKAEGDSYQLGNDAHFYELSPSTDMEIDINITGNSSSAVSNYKTYELTVQDEVILSLHGIIFILALVGNGLVSYMWYCQRKFNNINLPPIGCVL